MDLANFLIQLLNSVQYGLLLLMLAAGLTLIFGIMGVHLGVTCILGSGLPSCKTRRSDLVFSHGPTLAH